MASVMGKQTERACFPNNLNIFFRPDSVRYIRLDLVLISMNKQADKKALFSIKSSFLTPFLIFETR